MKFRCLVVILSFLILCGSALAQQTEPVKPPAELPNPAAKEPGFMDPPAVQALLHEVQLAEYRANDLLADVHEERWKMPDAVRSEVGSSVAEFRQRMNDMDTWRLALEKRPASAYLVFETYQTMSLLPPRLDALARLVSANDSPSFGAQYAAVGNRFLDAQQTLGAYVGYILRNQDQIVAAMEGNLSSCQSELTEAMRGRTPKATPIPNAHPVRPARRPRQTKPGEAKGATSKGTSKTEKSGGPAAGGKPQ